MVVGHHSLDRDAVRREAAAGWDTSEFLDVDVDQLAGSVAFVSDGGGLGGANQLTGQRVAVVQTWYPVASQDPGDRACRDANLVSQLVGPTSLLAARCEDAFFDVGRRLGRAGVRSR